VTVGMPRGKGEYHDMHFGIASVAGTYVAGLITQSRSTGEFWPAVLLRSLSYRLAGRRIIAHARCSIVGLRRIEVRERVDIGLRFRGNTHRWDRTYLNVRGSICFRGTYGIGRGCRFDIQEGGRAVFGSGFVNGPTTFVITNGLDVGDGTVISWNCLIIDCDFHHIVVDGTRRPVSAPISIGERVWIGAGVTVLKGVVIPSGCVVGAGSVLTKAFD
jgi:acetyltransferase-like isoleucine patch superfamily enzyme